MYVKKDKSLLNVGFMHHLIGAKDVESIKTEAYEKKLQDFFLISTLLLRYVKLKNGMTLRKYRFELRKKIDANDVAMRQAIAALTSEQFDLQEILEDFGFTPM